MEKIEINDSTVITTSSRDDAGVIQLYSMTADFIFRSILTHANMSLLL
jgi:hypothetical protein